MFGKRKYMADEALFRDCGWTWSITLYVTCYHLVYRYGIDQAHIDHIISHHTVQMLRTLMETTGLIQGLVRRLGSSAGIPPSEGLAWSRRSLNTSALSSPSGIHMCQRITVVLSSHSSPSTCHGQHSHRMVSSSSCSGHDECVRPGREEVAMNKDKLR